MEALIEKCKRKLRLTQIKYVRDVMNRIGWGNRLIAIRGAKGVGKTTLMLQYLKMHGCNGISSLYVSMDDGYFTQHTLTSFVDKFYKKGGKLLMLDEVHKYEGWSNELKNIYDDYPDLQVVVSSSSILNIMAADSDLSRRCLPYDIYGLSYREYLMLAHGVFVDKMPLEQLLANPDMLCEQVAEKCRPLEHFDEYLREGYYPFVLEDRLSYPIRVENVVNYILNVELPQLCGVEVGSVRKLKSLLTILSDGLPMQVDVSKLSTMIEVSRPTLLGYFLNLQQARLLNLLYSDETGVKKLQKPDKIYLENANLMSVLALTEANKGTMRETYLVNQLRAAGHRVEYSRQGDLFVDGRWTIEIGGKSKDGKQVAAVEDAYIAADNIDAPVGNKIPLWAFGFVY